MIVVASNYGGSRHPAWYYNVLANPGGVTISAGGYTGTFVGQEVMGAERDRLWNVAKAFIPPPYAEYERLAGGRTIPVLAFTETD